MRMRQIAIVSLVLFATKHEKAVIALQAVIQHPVRFCTSKSAASRLLQANKKTGGTSAFVSFASFARKL